MCTVVMLGLFLSLVHFLASVGWTVRLHSQTNCSEPELFGSEGSLHLHKQSGLSEEMNSGLLKVDQTALGF